jgi:membrane associated rhomboid family serine protease
MIGKGIRLVILAVLVGVAFRLLYAWLSGGGEPPAGLDTLAALLGLLVAGLVIALFERKHGREKKDE